MVATESPSENSNSNSNKAPTLNGKVIFPTKTILQGLRGQNMKVAAVYAILNHQYKRGSGDGWQYCEYIGITKDLQFVLDTYMQKMNAESIAYVKALSFTFPQKSVMEEISTSWRMLAIQANGPISINNKSLDSWIVVPVPGNNAVTSTSSLASDTASSTIDIPPQGKNPQRTQQVVEFIRATQYNDDDEDDDAEEEDEVLHLQETVLKVINNNEESTSVQQTISASTIVSPFMIESLSGTSQVLDQLKNGQEKQQHTLVFNIINVEKVLDEVRPFLISDGGNVSVNKVDLEKKDIYLKLTGACGTCSSSTVTMQMGIERTLRENFPDLGKVTQVGQDEASNLDSNEKVDNLTMEVVAAELNRISPAVTAMGAVCEIVSVDPIGVVELRYRGSTKVQNAVELALLDLPYVKHVKFV